jgi:hypothetical protein
VPIIPGRGPLASSALDDLFRHVAEEFLPALPWPGRRAVEAALLRDAAPGRSPSARPRAAARCGNGECWHEGSWTRRTRGAAVFRTVKQCSRHHDCREIGSERSLIRGIRQPARTTNVRVLTMCNPAESQSSDG